MRIRKILGRVVKEHISHSVAKLENDRYAVGQLAVGQMVAMDAQFETLDAAFNHWLATLPVEWRECSNEQRPGQQYLEPPRLLHADQKASHRKEA